MSEPKYLIERGSVPDESQLEEMLSQFKPQPSINYYIKMMDAKWMKNRDYPRKNHQLFNLKTPKLSLGIFLFLIILVLSSLIFIPAVRVVARQIIYSFISAPSNQIEIQVTGENRADLYAYSDPSKFTLSIQEAQHAAGYPVKVIPNLPEKFILIGSRYDAKYAAVIILYQSDKNNLFLTQRPLNKGEDVFSIGSEAQVDIVKIGDSQGEFVIGGWKVSQNSGTLITDDQVTLNAVWDNDLPQYTLRWQDSGFSYELLSLGEGSLSQFELINLANELK